MAARRRIPVEELSSILGFDFEGSNHRETAEHALCHSSCYPADPHLQKMQVVLGHVGERAIKLVNESMGYHQAQDFSSKISTIFTKDFLAGKSEALDIRNLIQTGNGLRSTSKDMAVVGFNAVLGAVYEAGGIRALIPVMRRLGILLLFDTPAPSLA